MLPRDIKKINVENMNQRDSVKEVETFVDSDLCYRGNILILYGLRRTGKTTIMEQIASEYSNAYQCAFYEVENSDDLYEVKKAIIEEKKKGTELICIDEITKASDFIDNSATLPDIFAKEGVRIIVTGTDSLGFMFAEDSELMDRTVRINTTHISFAEHCRVLKTNDIDDYIQYGGLMKKGGNEKGYVHDYQSACKYLDSAVAGNIAHSLERNPEYSRLEILTKEELKSVIEKMVELYSGKFNAKVIQSELNNASVNYPLNKMKGIASEDIIDRVILEKKNIVKEFASIINADTRISHEITEDMVRELEKYLIDMDVLSATKQITFSYTDEMGWREDGIKHEYFIIQPAIKYYHLQKGKEFIEEKQYYRELTDQQKLYMQKKLDEKIKGDMIEQIIVYDVGKDLPYDRYSVIKPVFFINGMKKGEYDMLIYDKESDRYWGFEIKHTSEPYYQQEQHLQNEKLREIIDTKYGHRENVCVLYRGNPFRSLTGTFYLNITDFMLSVDRNKDMDKVFEQLTKDLPTRNIFIEPNDRATDTKEVIQKTNRTSKAKEDEFER